MSKKYECADVRFNNGDGALLCNRCRVILAYGFDHEDTFHFCGKCEPHKVKWCLDTLAQQSQEWGEK